MQALWRSGTSSTRGCQRRSNSEDNDVRMHSDRRHTLPTRWFLASAAGGAIAGALYTLSPLGIYGLALVGLAIALAGAGLPATERQQLTVVLVVAILVRLLVLGAVFVRATPMHDDQFVASYSGDEAYSLARAM